MALKDPLSINSLFERFSSQHSREQARTSLRQVQKPKYLCDNCTQPNAVQASSVYCIAA
jgi:hypothetical protein